MRIAIVEDERKLAEALLEGLTAEEYEAVIFPTGEEFIQALTESESFDLVILDLGLPGIDGREVSAFMRSKQIMTPILVLTAHDTIADKVAALDSGADDFLAKPFNFDELMARIRALLRRASSQGGSVLTHRDLVLDMRERSVHRGNEQIVLTPTEFDLLYLLFQNRDKVISREEISNELWDVRDHSLSNIVDVHISNLRKKLGENHETKRIATVRGLGYQIA
jgi:two-component system copper resistance phosphate regulon response regulator CusR